jgi:hypothetical protein
MQLSSWKAKLLIVTLFVFLKHATFAEVPIEHKVVQFILDSQLRSNEADGLQDALRTTLTQAEKLPISATPPDSVRQVLQAPADYISVLSRFKAVQSRGELTDPAEVLDLQLLRFTDEFPQAANFCSFETQPLPDTLEELLDQVEAYARLSQGYYSIAVPQSQKMDLEETWDSVSSLLIKSPGGSNFDEVETLVVKKFLTQLNTIELQSVLCASLVWGQLLRKPWIDRLQQLMEDHPHSNSPLILKKITPLGEIVLAGSAGSRIQSDDLLLAVDLGGNDTYNITGFQSFTGKPQAIIDFAGDDTYTADQAGALASGIGQIGYLIDFQGDDQYFTKSYSLGIGIMGVGMLVDGGGNDQYNSESMAQGIGLYGIGLLVDQSGNDDYLLQTLGQGLGMTLGFGQLIDADGQDRYHSNSNLPTTYGTKGIKDSWVQGVGLGLRGISPGGVGVLMDLAGQDSYDAMSFAQGGGYYYGLGVLMDLGEANDSYMGARYNFGWGAHMGVGYFEEIGGDDQYRTHQIVAAGIAWDHSLAYFHDLSGNDIYDLGEFSLGATAHYSIATFMDSGGADIYQNVIPAESRKGKANISVFLDLGREPNSFERLFARPGCTLVAPFGYVLLAPSPTELLLDDCRP